MRRANRIKLNDIRIEVDKLEQYAKSLRRSDYNGEQIDNRGVIEAISGKLVDIRKAIKHTEQELAHHAVN